MWLEDMCFVWGSLEAVDIRTEHLPRMHTECATPHALDWQSVLRVQRTSQVFDHFTRHVDALPGCGTGVVEDDKNSTPKMTA